MKKTFLFTLCSFIYTFSNAQMIDISCGIKNLNIQKGDVDFIYEDESPVPDILETSVILKGRSTAFNISVDYENYRNEKRLYGIIRAQGYFGEINGGDLGIGIGYPLFLNTEGTFRLQPEILFVFGYNEKKLGTLSVQAIGSVYIQVNETKFGDYENVDVSLDKTYLTLRPGIKLARKLNDKTELRFFAGYHIGSGKGTISFSGKTDSGEFKSETEHIGDRNVYFRVNGNKTYDLPFSAKGYELRIGLAFFL